MGDQRVSPIFRYRSALPMDIWKGYDLNGDGANNDIFTDGLPFTGLDANGDPTYKELGACSHHQLRARRAACRS